MNLILEKAVATAALVIFFLGVFFILQISSYFPEKIAERVKELSYVGIPGILLSYFGNNVFNNVLRKKRRPQRSKKEKTSVKGATKSTRKT